MFKREREVHPFKAWSPHSFSLEFPLVHPWGEALTGRAKSWLLLGAEAQGYFQLAREELLIPWAPPLPSLQSTFS